MSMTLLKERLTSANRELGFLDARKSLAMTTRSAYRMQATTPTKSEKTRMRCSWVICRAYESTSRPSWRSSSKSSKSFLPNSTQSVSSSWSAPRKVKTTKRTWSIPSFSFRMKFRKSEATQWKYGQMNKSVWFARSLFLPSSTSNKAKTTKSKASTSGISPKATSLSPKKNRIRSWRTKLSTQKWKQPKWRLELQSTIHRRIQKTLLLSAICRHQWPKLTISRLRISNGKYSTRRSCTMKCASCSRIKSASWWPHRGSSNTK